MDNVQIELNQFAKILVFQTFSFSETLYLRLPFFSSSSLPKSTFIVRSGSEIEKKENVISRYQHRHSLNNQNVNEHNNQNIRESRCK